MSTDKPVRSEQPALDSWDRQIIAKLSKELLELNRDANDKWSEAFSIPSGCGCTPFYADAREASQRLAKKCKQFVEKFGKSEIEKLYISKRGDYDYGF